MDPLIARKTWRTLEPVHGAIYFVPEAREEYSAIGIDDRMQGYFASRSAPISRSSRSSSLPSMTYSVFIPSTNTHRIGTFSVSSLVTTYLFFCPESFFILTSFA